MTNARNTIDKYYAETIGTNTKPVSTTEIVLADIAIQLRELNSKNFDGLEKAIKSLAHEVGYLPARLDDVTTTTDATTVEFL